MKTSIKSIFIAAFMGLFIGTNAFALTTLEIGPKGQLMEFDKKELTVKAGAKVKLTFKNASAMQHNWVLVKPGTIDKVATASIQAGAAKGWLAEGPNVLAHTAMIDPKKSGTVEFQAPTTPGEYPYVCTFPGHAGTMRGILKVTK